MGTLRINPCSSPVQIQSGFNKTKKTLLTKRRVIIRAVRQNLRNLPAGPHYLFNHLKTSLHKLGQFFPFQQIL